MNESLLVAYLLTIAVVILTPGPDMLFCLASGLEGGPRPGCLAAVGAASGVAIHITASAVGLAALLRAAPPVFDAVRVLGAAYLLLLGIGALRNRAVSAGAGETATGPHHRAYWRGLATNLMNPKMALFSVSFLPQYIDPSAGPIATQFVVLGSLFVLLDLLVDGSVGILAGRFGRLLRSPGTRRRVNVVAGCVYIGLGLRMGLER